MGRLKESSIQKCNNKTASPTTHRRRSSPRIAKECKMGDTPKNRSELDMSETRCKKFLSIPTLKTPIVLLERLAESKLIPLLQRHMLKSKTESTESVNLVASTRFEKRRLRKRTSKDEVSPKRTQCIRDENTPLCWKNARGTRLRSLSKSTRAKMISSCASTTSGSLFTASEGLPSSVKSYGLRYERNSSKGALGRRSVFGEKSETTSSSSASTDADGESREFATDEGTEEGTVRIKQKSHKKKGALGSTFQKSTLARRFRLSSNSSILTNSSESIATNYRGGRKNNSSRIDKTKSRVRKAKKKLSFNSSSGESENNEGRLLKTEEIVTTSLTQGSNDSERNAKLAENNRGNATVPAADVQLFDVVEKGREKSGNESLAANRRNKWRKSSIWESTKKKKARNQTNDGMRAMAVVSASSSLNSSSQQSSETITELYAQDLVQKTKKRKNPGISQPAETIVRGESSTESKQSSPVLFKGIKKQRVPEAATLANYIIPNVLNCTAKKEWPDLFTELTIDNKAINSSRVPNVVYETSAYLLDKKEAPSTRAKAPTMVALREHVKSSVKAIPVNNASLGGNIEHSQSPISTRKSDSNVDKVFTDNPSSSVHPCTNVFGNISIAPGNDSYSRIGSSKRALEVSMDEGKKSNTNPCFPSHDTNTAPLLGFPFDAEFRKAIATSTCAMAYENISDRANRQSHPMRNINDKCTITSKKVPPTNDTTVRYLHLATSLHQYGAKRRNAQTEKSQALVSEMRSEKINCTLGSPPAVCSILTSTATDPISPTKKKELPAIINIDILPRNTVNVNIMRSNFERNAHYQPSFSNRDETVTNADGVKPIESKSIAGNACLNIARHAGDGDFGKGTSDADASAPGCRSEMHSESKNIEGKLVSAVNVWKTIPEIGKLLQEDKHHLMDIREGMKEFLHFNDDTLNNNVSNENVACSTMNVVFTTSSSQQSMSDYPASFLNSDCELDNFLNHMTSNEDVLKLSPAIINSEIISEALRNIGKPRRAEEEELNPKERNAENANDLTSDRLKDVNRNDSSLSGIRENCSALDTILNCYPPIFDNLNNSNEVSGGRNVQNVETSFPYEGETIQSHKDDENERMKRKRRWTSDVDERNSDTSTSPRKIKIDRKKWLIGNTRNDKLENDILLNLSAFDVSSALNVIKAKTACEVQTGAQNCDSAVSNVRDVLPLNANERKGNRQTVEMTTSISNLRERQEVRSEQRTFDMDGGKRNGDLNSCDERVVGGTPVLCNFKENHSLGRETNCSSFEKLTSRSNDGDTSGGDSSSNSSSSSSKSSDDSSERTIISRNVEVPGGSRVNNNGSENCLREGGGTIEENVQLTRDSELDDQGDGISLFTESINLSVDGNFDKCEPKMTKLVTNSSLDDPYASYNKNFDTYLKKNKAECEENFMVYEENDQDAIVDFPKRDTNTFSDAEQFFDLQSHQITFGRVANPIEPVISSRYGTNSKGNIKEKIGGFVKQSNDKPFVEIKHLFKGCCFRLMTCGKCYNREKCKYDHDLGALVGNLQSELTISSVIEKAILKKFWFIARHVYLSSLYRMSSDVVMKLFSELYSANVVNENVIVRTIKTLLCSKIPSIVIVNKIVDIMKETDKFTAEVTYTTISPTIIKGQCWTTFRNLFIKIIPSKVCIATVVSECIDDEKDKLHLEDVYLNLICKLPQRIISNVDKTLIDAFRKRLRNLQNKNLVNARNNLPIINRSSDADVASASVRTSPNEQLTLDLNKNCNKVDTIASSDTAQTLDASNDFNKKLIYKRSTLQDCVALSSHETINTSLYSSSHCTVTRDTNDPSKEKKKLDWLGIQTPQLPAINIPSEFNDRYILHPIDNLAKPQSQFRSKFWKLNLDVESIKEGLKHQDYVYVLNILDKHYLVSEESLFNRNCYHLLRKEVMHSAHHLRNIIQLSVYTGASARLREMLCDLGMCVLTELAEVGAWVLAYELLKSLKIYGTRANNATFTLLSAEIYLANQKPLKALATLRQSNIIFTNRKKWHVHSGSKDVRLRAITISCLLDILCYEFIEDALSVFEFLLKDQVSVFHPIDLTRHVHKIVLVLLTKKLDESTIQIGKLIIKYNLTLADTLARALITNIIHTDCILAKKLYQYASWLGIYSTIQVNFPIHVLVNTNWTGEEIYLTLSELFHKLLMNIGHTIERMLPWQLSVYLIFEIVPTKSQLYADNIKNHSNCDIIKASKVLVQQILKQKFDPSINMIVKKQSNRICKIQYGSLLKHLKTIHTLQIH